MSGAWDTTVAACLVGADRARAGPLPPGLDVAEGDGPSALLVAAAALGSWRMAGATPDVEAAPLPPVEDAWPECGDGAAVLLECLLTTPTLPNALVYQWCRLAQGARLRAPAGLAPALARHVRTWRHDEAFDAVLGARREWLAPLDPDGMPAADWSSADLASRVQALRAMREADAGSARIALAEVWASDKADAREKLLGVLQAGLGDADEPFLEQCLDDRAAGVRAEAARLLSHLPASAFARRMQVRAQAAVQLRRGLLRTTLHVSLPEQDAAGKRDGLAMAAGQAGQGAALLSRLVAAAPLSSWEAGTPERWVAAAVAGEWGDPLVAGWADAAAREREGSWADAVLSLKGVTGVLNPDTLAALLQALDGPVRERRAATMLRDGPERGAQSLLDCCTWPWSAGFTGVVVAFAAKVMPGHDWALRLAGAAPYADPGAADTLERLVPQLGDASRRDIEAAIATLRLRAAMTQELAPA